MKKALVLFVLAFVPVVNAAIVCDISPGAGAPPGTLGGYTMTAFPADPQPSGYTSVDGVDGPCGRISFSPACGHAIACSEWATWSHGYCGDIYWTQGALSLTITLPGGVSAFYFYAEPNPFAVYTITATANDGTSCSQDISGSAGASYFGFYNAAGTVASVSISSAADFAVGEFGAACGPVGCPCDAVTQVKAICTSRGTLIAIVKATATGTCTIDVSGIGTSTVNLAQGRRGIKGTAIFRGVGAGHTVCLPECPSVPCGSC